MTLRYLPAVVLLLAAPAAAQQHQMEHGAEHTGDHMVAAVRTVYEGVKNNVIRSGEMIPDAELSFKPVPEVRSFGQMLGHVANSNYSYCSTALGVENPNAGKDIEEITDKAALVQAVKDSFAHCDRAFQMNDGQVMQMTEGRTPRMKLWYLVQVTSHGNEHYGNLVTYFRLKGMVPPSSQPRG
jgi:uncharacterized damage-inducible protein DinB